MPWGELVSLLQCDLKSDMAVADIWRLRRANLNYNQCKGQLLKGISCHFSDEDFALRVGRWRSSQKKQWTKSVASPFAVLAGLMSCCRLAETEFVTLATERSGLDGSIHLKLFHSALRLAVALSFSSLTGPIEAENHSVTSDFSRNSAMAAWEPSIEPWMSRFNVLWQ